MKAIRKMQIVWIPSILVFFLKPDIVSARSNLSDSYDDLFALVTVLSIIVALGVIILWAYFIYKFREDNEEVDRTPLSHELSRKLEMTWTLVAVAIVILLMIFSYPVLAKLDSNENLTGPNNERASDILVEAVPFSWIFSSGGVWDSNAEEYFSGDRVGSTINLEVDKAYRFIFISRTELIHSFFVYELNLKMDVLPGVYNTFNIIIEDPGTYQVLCTEYCGNGHSQMRAFLEVT